MRGGGGRGIERERGRVALLFAYHVINVLSMCRPTTSRRQPENIRSHNGIRILVLESNPWRVYGIRLWVTDGEELALWTLLLRLHEAEEKQVIVAATDN